MGIPFDFVAAGYQAGLGYLAGLPAGAGISDEGFPRTASRSRARSPTENDGIPIGYDFVEYTQKGCV